jgi:hypothetical protein
MQDFVRAIRVDDETRDAVLPCPETQELIVREGIALVSDLCTDATMQQDALDVVEHTCELFQGMYDGVAKRHLAGV